MRKQQKQKAVDEHRSGPNRRFASFSTSSDPTATTPDTIVIKSDISDTLGCAREVTFSKAFIIRCMTDLNIYKIAFNN